MFASRGEFEAEVEQRVEQAVTAEERRSACEDDEDGIYQVCGDFQDG